MQKLNVNSGQALLVAALAPASEGKDYWVVNRDINLDKPFIIYQVLSHHHYGSEFYAVNAFTGDVWNTLSCMQLANANLLAEQAKIKSQFQGDAIKGYTKLHLLRPINPALELC
jgi:hypothetical protein